MHPQYRVKVQNHQLAQLEQSSYQQWLHNFLAG